MKKVFDEEEEKVGSGTDSMECHILPKTPEKFKNTITVDGINYKTARAESQEDSSFPADGQQAMLNKANRMSKTYTKKTNTDLTEALPWNGQY